jgi:hypothetical protein
VATPSPFPYGLSNAAVGYSRSMHLTPVPPTTDSLEDSYGWARVVSPGLHNLEDLCQLATMNEYLFDYHESSEDNYDPSRECFHVEVEEIAPRDATPVEQGAHAPCQ